MRLTRDEHDGIIRDIAEKTNASPEVLDLLDRLKTDFDESLSVDTSEWEKKLRDTESERDRAIGERDEARKAYRDRFFNRMEKDEILEVPADDTPKTIDEVLRYRKEV